MRRVLVTGASRGIGRAVAIAFAARGDRVAVHYGRDRAAAEQTMQVLPGPGHAIVAGDLADPDAGQRIASDTVQALGGIDVLVNNAGMAPTPGNAHRVAEVEAAQWQQAWQHMLEVNLLGPVHLTYAVARHLIARDAPGHIVNIGSRGAFRGEPDYPAYGASKAALQTFGQSIAIALAPHGISVASVAQASWKPNARNPNSLRPKAILCAQRAPSGASAPPQRSPPPSSTWPHRKPPGHPAPSSTSTAPPTCAPDAPDLASATAHSPTRSYRLRQRPRRPITLPTP